MYVLAKVQFFMYNFLFNHYFFASPKKVTKKTMTCPEIGLTRKVNKNQDEAWCYFC